MKKFWKIVLAVVTGIIAFNLILFLFILCIAGGSSKGKTPSIPSEGILKMDLSKVIIQDQARETFNMVSLGQTGQMPKVLGIRQTLRAIDYAATDPGVKCIYLKPEGATLGMSGMYEVRESLKKFRESGKPVVAYIENISTGGFYLASVADKVYLSACEGANPMFNGLSGRLIFLKDILDELGINIQLIRHGKYKSAGEMYIRNSSSPENYEQTKVYIDGIWDVMAGGMAESRGLEKKAIDKAIDNLQLCLPKDFLDFGLVDELVDRQGLENKLAILAGKQNYNQVAFIPFADYAKAKVTDSYRIRNKIAVVYADGEIVDGNDPLNVDGDRFASIIEQVRADSTIKAVVLRVNSPGGSVVASEKIKKELDLLKEVKPLVASYGDYAASGGYWISNNADKIYCEPLTITGSIGVFGMVPDFSKAVKEKLKIGIEAVNSNKHGDMWALMRPLDAKEYAYVQRSIENIYSRFVSTVAQGRSLEESYVDSIAQGRVWVGTDALRLSLVDEMGSLEDALNYAAISAGFNGVGDCYVDEYPQQLPLAQQIALALSEDEPADYSIKAFKTWYGNWMNGKCEFTFARIPYSLTIL